MSSNQVFVCDSQDDKVAPSVTAVTGVDQHGRKCIADSAFAVAKEAYDEDTSTFVHFVKFHAMGRMSLTMFNPLEGDEATLSQSTAYQFTKVKKQVYDCYVQFLKSKNPAHLRLAEREHHDN